MFGVYLIIRCIRAKHLPNRHCVFNPSSKLKIIYFMSVLITPMAPTFLVVLTPRIEAHAAPATYCS